MFLLFVCLSSDSCYLCLFLCFPDSAISQLLFSTLAVQHCKTILNNNNNNTTKLLWGYMTNKTCQPPVKEAFQFRSSFFSLQSSSCIEDCLPLKVVFHQKSPSIKSCLPSKVIFQSSSFIKGRLVVMVVHAERFPCLAKLWSC